MRSLVSPRLQSHNTNNGDDADDGDDGGQYTTNAVTAGQRQDAVVGVVRMPLARLTNNPAHLEKQAFYKQKLGHVDITPSKQESPFTS